MIASALSQAFDFFTVFAEIAVSAFFHGRSMEFWW
jgi:hypothetical protein